MIAKKETPLKVMRFLFLKRDSKNNDMVCESELGTQNNIHRKLVFAAYMLWYLGFPCHNTIQLSLCPALMYSI